MIIEHRKNEDRFNIDTGNHDPVMVIGLLKEKMHEMYDIVIEDDSVIVHKIPCIEI
jgi:hypothetical protein